MLISVFFVDGAWVKSDQQSDVISPVTETPLGRVYTAATTDTARAIDAADKARAALLDMGGFGPIRIGPALMVYLDPLNRRNFLAEWENAIVQQ